MNPLGFVMSLTVKLHPDMAKKTTVGYGQTQDWQGLATVGGASLPEISNGLIILLWFLAGIHGSDREYYVVGRQ